MKRAWVVASVVAVGVGVGASAWAGAIELAPHRAVYSMGLATMKPGSGLAGANGSMSYEFADACDGWVVENRIAITYTYTEGGQALSATDFITWESKDGLKYRFRMRNTRDGQITEEVEGTAELKGKGQGGVAHFTRPEPMNIALPKGTLFPTEHTQRLLESAQSGGKSFWKVVFDGSGTEGPYEVNALIGQPRPSPALAPAPVPSKAANALVIQPSWPMRMAFFPVASKDAEPNFEMVLNYHPNGVAQEIQQSFKNFSLKGRLEKVEALPRRGC
ncbi:MAG: cell envelope integrity EipB family protein [Solirubrobacterales bacterium]